jgi:hypothetical protein
MTKALALSVARLLLVAFILGGGSVANARDYGRWLCAECTVDIRDARQNVQMTGEVLAFIKANPPTSMWQPLDTISICDGVNCLLVVYRFGSFYPVGGVYPDPKLGYKNSRNTQPTTSSSGSGSNYSVSVTGHWEWYDYYSNGVYTHSDDFIFVITSLTVSYYNSGWNHGGDICDSVALD